MAFCWHLCGIGEDNGVQVLLHYVGISVGLAEGMGLVHWHLYGISGQGKRRGPFAGSAKWLFGHLRSSSSRVIRAPWPTGLKQHRVPSSKLPPGLLCARGVSLPTGSSQQLTPCEHERLYPRAVPPGPSPVGNGHVPQCDEQGNYRPLQCHGSTGHCWCVDSAGQEIAGTRTAPGSTPPRCGSPGGCHRAVLPKASSPERPARLQ